jgi:hypothetical protein
VQIVHELLCHHREGRDRCVVAKTGTEAKSSGTFLLAS